MKQEQFIYELQSTGRINKLPVLSSNILNDKTLVCEIENFGFVIFTKGHSVVKKSNSYLCNDLIALTSCIKGTWDKDIAGLQEKLDYYKNQATEITKKILQIENESKMIEDFIASEKKLISLYHIQKNLNNGNEAV